MKKTIIVGVVLLALAGISSAAEAIVFVDLERVFNEFYKTKLAKSRIAVQQDDLKDERKMRVDEMTLLSDEVDTLKKEARDITLSQEIRDEKRIQYEERLLELRATQKEIDEFVARREQQLQQQVTRMSQTIMDEIRQMVVEYAKQQGIMGVIDSSNRRAAVGVFIYTHSDVDITEAILNKLNSKRPNTLDEEGNLIADTADEEEVGEE